MSFDVSQGEVLGLVGPNGSGKTTIFNILSRLSEPDQGTILLYGSDISRFRCQDMAHKGVARLFQTSHLCAALTVFENVAMGMYFRVPISQRVCSWQSRAVVKGAVLNVLELFGILNVKNSLPSELSFFQQRKVEFARLHASRPSLVLLDEPSSGFSASERDELVDMLQKVTTGPAAVILIEHDLAMVRRVCSRVIVLDAGRKIAEGVPENVISDPLVRQVFLGASLAASS